MFSSRRARRATQPKPSRAEKRAAVEAHNAEVERRRTEVPGRVDRAPEMSALLTATMMIAAAGVRR